MVNDNPPNVKKILTPMKIFMGFYLISLVALDCWTTKESVQVQSAFDSLNAIFSLLVLLIVTDSVYKILKAT